MNNFKAKIRRRKTRGKHGDLYHSQCFNQGKKGGSSWHYVHCINPMRFLWRVFVAIDMKASAKKRRLQRRQWDVRKYMPEHNPQLREKLGIGEQH